MKFTLENVDAAIASGTAEIFENTVFMEVLPAPEGTVFDPDEAIFYTRLPVYKPHPAMVGLVIPQSLALRLAEAMMMREFNMEDDEFEVHDVLGELANMLAGSIFTHLLPEMDSFELGLPECRVLSSANQGQEWDNAKPHTFLLEDTPLLVTWEGD
ncbi:chemotaxis protein CheX [bacterium]|nr:chemotaxis protein CheX [bacterium]